jgi:hypothetical protein
MQFIELLTGGSPDANLGAFEALLLLLPLVSAALLYRLRPRVTGKQRGRGGGGDSVGIDRRPPAGARHRPVKDVVIASTPIRATASAVIPRIP